MGTLRPMGTWSLTASGFSVGGLGHQGLKRVEDFAMI